jgi:hypothetical protein
VHRLRHATGTIKLISKLLQIFWSKEGSTRKTRCPLVPSIRHKRLGNVLSPCHNSSIPCQRLPHVLLFLYDFPLISAKRKRVVVVRLARIVERSHFVRDDLHLIQHIVMPALGPSTGREQQRDAQAEACPAAPLPADHARRDSFALSPSEFVVPLVGNQGTTKWSNIWAI